MSVNKKILIPFITLSGSLVIAGVLVYLTLKGEKSYLESLQNREITNTINIDETLFRAERSIKAGEDSSYYFKRLERLNIDRMSAEQRLKYMTLMGDFYLARYRVVADPKVRQLLFDRAVKQYTLASQLTNSPAMRNSLMRRNAMLHMENRNWNAAVEMLEQCLPMLASPYERWEADLAMAQCYLKLGQFEAAFTRFGSAANSDDPEIQGKAINSRGEIMLDALADPKLKHQLITFLAARFPEAEQAVRDKKVDDYLKTGAAALFHQVERKLDKSSAGYSQSQLGLIRIAVADRNSQDAYAIANRLLFGASSKEDKVAAILLLAKLEEELGKYQEAIELVKKALQDYPVAASSLNAGMVLYNLYKKIEDWSAAFSVARNLFQRTSDPDAICQLISDFSSGKNMIFDLIVNSSDRGFYISQLEKVYEDLRENFPEDWNAIRVKAYYVVAQIHFSSGNIPLAEAAINKCYFFSANPADIDEKVYRLDLVCATKGKLSPVIVGARARRYLGRYPKGPYYREALLELLRSYFSMGLYEPALNVSRKIYADELDTAKKQSKDVLWLETIATIAQCYYELGQSERANRLIRNFSIEILNEKYGADIYYIWAMMAIRQKQMQEALRRLDVALSHTNDPRIQLKIRLAQRLLLIQAGSLKDYHEAGRLLRTIRTGDWLDDAARRDYERQIIEAMLEYAMTNGMTRDFDLLIKTAVKQQFNWPWTSYWILKSLTPLFQLPTLTELNAKHEALLKDEFAEVLGDKESYEFVQEQLKIIKGLIGLETRADFLKNSKGIRL